MNRLTVPAGVTKVRVSLGEPMTFEVYRRLTWRGAQWFWRLRAKNNRIVANGGEGFHNKGDVLKIIDKIAALDSAQVKWLD